MGMDAGGSGGLRNEINVTPLVDVCLVLLIIFMVVTPMLQEGIPVQLPNALNPQPMPKDEKDLIITVSGDPGNYGKIFVGDSWIPNTEILKTTLSEEYARNASKPIYLKGDRRLTFGQVKELFMVIQDVGFKHVGLVSQHVDDKGNPVTGNAAEAVAGK